MPDGLVGGYKTGYGTSFYGSTYTGEVRSTGVAKAVWYLVK